jgi:hypothetical protein
VRVGKRGTYHFAAVDAMLMGDGDKARDLLLDVPFSPSFLIF